MQRYKYGINPGLGTDYQLDWEDWLYIAYLAMSSIVAFGVGLITGFVWVKFL